MEIMNPIKITKLVGNLGIGAIKYDEILIANPGEKGLDLSRYGLKLNNIIEVEINPKVRFNFSDKVKYYYKKYILRQFQGPCFQGLYSELFYVKLIYENKNDVSEGIEQIKDKISKDMDKKENNLIKKALKKYKNYKVVLIRRRISPEIAKIMGIKTKEMVQRAIIVSPLPVHDEKISGRLQLGVFGYEGIIILLVKK